MNLLSNVHLGLDIPPSSSQVHVIKGTYKYYHYNCDGFNDVGWGCGYRTLQTIVSFFQHQKGTKACDQIPSIRQIQEILVNLEDKGKSFLGSKDWIGTFEICLVMDQLFEIPCKIIHSPSGKDLITSVFPKLEQHFQKFACPVMMGGDRDASSKGILGTCISANEPHLLILDPHYHGKLPSSASQLQKEGYIKWTRINELDLHSFYNICLPQFEAAAS